LTFDRNDSSPPEPRSGIHGSPGSRGRCVTPEEFVNRICELLLTHRALPQSLDQPNPNRLAITCHARSDELATRHRERDLEPERASAARLARRVAGRVLFERVDEASS
jgi:hypothetical protein